MSPMSPRLLRPRASGATHPEARDWATRVTANGGSVGSSTLKAVDTFCRSIDAASGLRAAILRCNLFCGNNLEAALVPLYRGSSLAGTQLGNTTDTNSNFVSGDFSSTGLKGDGTTKYLSTGVTPNLLPSLSSVHFSFSGTSLETTGDRIVIGIFDGSQNNLYTMDLAQATTSRRGARIASGTVIGEASPTATSESHMLSTRRSNTDLETYRAGVSLATSSTSSTPSGSTRAFTVFAISQSTSPSIAAYTAARLRMYSIGSGMTTAQVLSFSNAVSALNTALGRS